jgi:rubrerythrin
METQTRLGMNRTGMQMSPHDSRELLQVADGSVSTDMVALRSARESYIAEADPLGSIPLPGSVKGVVVTGAKLLTGKHPEQFIDRLAERLAFERGGTRLYDALISKYNATEDKPAQISLGALLEIRNEEAEHFHMLTECITSLGGDPTAQTPAADLVGVEAAGLIQAVSDARTTFAQSLHAVLVAELADNDAWELLASMAEAIGEDEMAERFRAALGHETEHLARVRGWYQKLSLESVL